MQEGTMVLATRTYITPELVAGVEELCIILRVSFNMARIEWVRDGVQTAKPISDLRDESNPLWPQAAA